MARNKQAEKTTTEPEVPETLDGEALLEWHRLTEELRVAGMLARCDRPALMTYCHAWAQMVDAQRNIAKTGTVIKLPNGYPGPTPYLKVFNESAKLCTRLLSEFGATPQARRRIPTKATGDEPDELEI